MDIDCNIAEEACSGEEVKDVKKNILELTRIGVEEYRSMEKTHLSVMTDNVRSMHNIGSIFRTCDAFAVRRIILAGISGQPPHPEISKTALGADETVEWIYVKDAYEKVVELKQSGVKILVLEQTHRSVSLPDFRMQPGEEYLLVAGNEVEGVDPRIVEIADTALEIPMRGVKHSLNVAVATGMAIYQLLV